MKLKCPSPLCFSSESDDDYRVGLKQHFVGDGGGSGGGGGTTSGTGGKSISLLKRIGTNLLQNLNYGPSGSMSVHNEGGSGGAEEVPRQFYHAYDYQHQQREVIASDEQRQESMVEPSTNSAAAKYRYRAPVYAPQPYFCKKYEIERKHKIKKRDLVRLQSEGKYLGVCTMHTRLMQILNF